MKSVTGFYAHTPGEGSEWHDLALHLRETATRARDNAAKFGAGEVGYLAGLWHDVGKFNPAFQEYLVLCESADHKGDPPPAKSVPHAVYGSKLARESYPPLTQVIYGHHGGLPEIERAKERISAPDLAETFAEVTQLAAEHLDGFGQPFEPAALLADPPRNAWEYELFLRMVFSALVDADFLDTEAHFDPESKERSYMSIVIQRIEGGKIAEEWGVGTSVSELREGWVATWQRKEQERIERERLEHELQVARRIQQASLPKEVPTIKGWQISPFYRPAREVGGDFYDFHLLSEGHVGLVVGDATGKGVPAALVMSSTRSMLRALARTSNSPGEVLEQVNELLVADIPQNMFVTCFYAILDPKSGRLVYANAGHDLPYLCSYGDEAEELRARGMPLGLMPGMSYEENEITLQAAEAALFYSDGLVEAHDSEREMFGFPRLKALVAKHAGEARALGESLMEELYLFVGEGWEQEDDITLLSLQRSPLLS